MWEEKGEWTADDNHIWMVFLNQMRETNRDAKSDIAVRCLAANRGGLNAIGGANSVTGGNILPL